MKNCTLLSQFNHERMHTFAKSIILGSPLHAAVAGISRQLPEQSSEQCVWLAQSRSVLGASSPDAREQLVSY